MTPRRRHQPLSGVLGPLEADVMETVWERQEATVRDVHQALTEKRPVAYTTVLTTMGRLTEKGLLRRVESQPAHHYFPLVTREQYASSIVKSVVDWLVNHFRDPAVAYFLDRVEEEDQAVIDSIREAIEQREAKEPKKPGTSRT